jgi:hypothetical protein
MEAATSREARRRRITEENFILPSTTVAWPWYAINGLYLVKKGQQFSEAAPMELCVFMVQLVASQNSNRSVFAQEDFLRPKYSFTSRHYGATFIRFYG